MICATTLNQSKFIMFLINTKFLSLSGVRVPNVFMIHSIRHSHNILNDVIMSLSGYAEGYHHSHGYHSATALHSPLPPPPHVAPHHPPPYTHGYVPHPLDHVEGQAYGHDLVGPFYHHSGPFGPFGFYANFFHEK